MPAEPVTPVTAAGLSINEAARRLGVDRNSVYHRMRRGTMRWVMEDGHRRIPLTELRPRYRRSYPDALRHKAAQVMRGGDSACAGWVERIANGHNPLD